MNSGDRIKDLRNLCETYNSTVLAIQALAHELLWDDKTRAFKADGTGYVGRRMDTSPTNRRSPRNTVTPDLVLKLNSRYGVVAEAKITLPKNLDHRIDKLLALEKYDDNLIGWDTPKGKIERHDIVLIVDHFRAVEVSDQVKELVKSKRLRFERKFGIISHAVVEKEQTWLSLELSFGELTDKEKTSKLRKRLPLELSRVLGSPGSPFGHIKLYDADPPYPNLMQLIHEVIFENLTRDERLQLEETGTVKTTVKVKDLRNFLSSRYGPGDQGPRIPEIPRTDWVKVAMRYFEQMKWVVPVDKRKGTYDYTVKKRKKQFEQFLKVCSQPLQKGKGPEKKQAEEQQSFNW